VNHRGAIAEVTMTPIHSIEDALMRVQDAFLDDHALTIDAAQASSRFGLPAVDCEVILAALLRRGVLAKTPEGGYVRFLPRLSVAAHAGGQCPALADRAGTWIVP
jgi:hypothetical protein